MFCIFFPDIYIKENNSKFQSITTLGIKAQGRRQQTDTGTHRIYTVTGTRAGQKLPLPFP